MESADVHKLREAGLITGEQELRIVDHFQFLENRTGLGGQERRVMDPSPHPAPLLLGTTLAKGRGVFAGRAFAMGELVEAATVLVIPAEQWHHIEPTVLALYIFNFGPEGEHAAIALGYGSLYNHSYSPNADYEHGDKVLVYRALRDIEAGEEITVNYNGRPSDHSPVGFEVV
jgi:hypothetical protein